jgi:YHS domain-containing protein
MKRLFALSAAGLFCLAGLTFVGCAQNKGSESASSADVNPAVVDLNNTKCPVTGDPVGSSKLTEIYQGKIYHFCCDDCPKDFKKNPEKYAKAVAADPAKYGVK